MTAGATYFHAGRCRNYAPNLCNRSSYEKNDINHSSCPVTGAISMGTHIAYANWATHHTECETCGVEDWYQPDIDRLCRQGRFLFGSWYGNSAKSELS